MVLQKQDIFLDLLVHSSRRITKWDERVYLVVCYNQLDNESKECHNNPYLEEHYVAMKNQAKCR